MKENMDSEFYTLKGYRMQSKYKITEAMEDYLEMISRNTIGGEAARINAIAAKLNVRPSSASKMVGRLKELELVEFEKYGIIKLTDKGREIGDYLLWRHDVLHKFFCLLNNSTDELMQVEQIEHFMNEKTVRNIEALVLYAKSFFIDEDGGKNE